MLSPLGLLYDRSQGTRSRPSRSMLPRNASLLCISGVFWSSSIHYHHHDQHLKHIHMDRLYLYFLYPFHLFVPSPKHQKHRHCSVAFLGIIGIYLAAGFGLLDYIVLAFRIFADGAELLAAQKPPHTADSPPSRLITQLCAYSFCARNSAAEAISSGLPSRPSGMRCESAAWSRPARLLVSPPSND
jgi:hypothetical protein